MNSMDRFGDCPLCGERVDLDEHTECTPLWSVSSDGVVENIRAETAEDAACRYVMLRDSTIADGSMGVAELGGLLIVSVTSVDNGESFVIVVTGRMEPKYTATWLKPDPALVAVGNPHISEP